MVYDFWWIFEAFDCTMWLLTRIIHNNHLSHNCEFLCYNKLIPHLIESDASLAAELNLIVYTYYRGSHRYAQKFLLEAYTFYLWWDLLYRRVDQTLDKCVLGSIKTFIHTKITYYRADAVHYCQPSENYRHILDWRLISPRDIIQRGRKWCDGTSLG